MLCHASVWAGAASPFVFGGLLVLAGLAPRADAEEWETATPAEVGLDSDRLDALTRHVRETPELNVHSILVVKDGRLAYEQYFAGEDQTIGRNLGRVEFGPDDLHDLRSVTKSVTAALVGIAIDTGRLPGRDARVVDLLPAYAEGASEAARALELEHLLTMSAGLAWDESIPYSNPENSEIQMSMADDPIGYVLAQPAENPPGRSFNYNGGLTTLLAGILEAATGRPLEEFAEEVLFEPLGIDTFEWFELANGLPAPASGLRLRPRDLAKFGELYLNGGRWGDRRVVSSDWVARSTASSIEPNRLVGYGYQWWVQTYELDGRMHDVPTASGNGGQRIFLLSDLDMVVVTTAGNYNASSLREQFLPEALLVEFVLPAAGVGEVVTAFDRAQRFFLALGIAFAVAVMIALWAVIAFFRRRRRARAATAMATG